MKTITKYILFCLPYLLMAQTTPAPDVLGSFTVSETMYDLGNEAFVPTNFRNAAVDVKGIIYAPTTLPNKKLPVVMLVHGRHATAFREIKTEDSPNESIIVPYFRWPYNTPATADENQGVTEVVRDFTEIPSLRGYKELGELLASHGYVVISISTNGINANDSRPEENFGQDARAELIQHHFDLLNKWNTTGNAPNGINNRFVGKLDLQNIGLMGHSRGGEGIVKQAILNESLGSPYGIKAILTLAPQNIFRDSVLGHINLLNITPYCDGDVFEVLGLHYYDDSRNVANRTNALHNITVLGANHNYFNSIWTPKRIETNIGFEVGADDWGIQDNFQVDTYCGTIISSNKRLAPVKQREILNAYGTAFFRLYLKNENQFAPLLNLEDSIPPRSIGIDKNQLHVSYHAPVNQSLALNTIESTEGLVNTQGGAISTSNLNTYAICETTPSNTDKDHDDSCISGVIETQEPHTYSILRRLGTGKVFRQVANFFNKPSAVYENIVTDANKDVSGYTALQFRGAPIFNNDYGDETHLDFSIEIEDEDGETQSVAVSDYSRALFIPRGSTAKVTPKILLNTVRIPLSAYTEIDLTKIEVVRFKYDRSGTKTRDFLFNDLIFVGKNPSNSIDTNTDYDTVSNKTIQLYPNPVQDILYVNLNLSQESLGRVYNIQGQEIESLILNKGTNIINMTTYIQGVYLLKVTDAITGIVTVKRIVKN